MRLMQLSGGASLLSELKESASHLVNGSGFNNVLNGDVFLNDKHDPVLINDERDGKIRFLFNLCPFDRLKF